MSLPSQPRLCAGIALSLAVLLTAAPLWAQDAGSAPPATVIEPSPAQSGAGQPTATSAPEETDTAAPAAPDATSQTMATPAPSAGTPEAPEAPAAPSDAAQAVEPDATGATQMAQPQPGAGPVPAAPAEPASRTEDSFFPDIIQQALEPLAPQERDPTLPHDLSPMGMFWAADLVVKGVMLGLAFASIVTWTVLVAKFLELAGAMNRVRNGIRRIETASSLPAALSAIGKRRDPVSRMIRAAASEYDRSAPALDVAGDSGLKERVESHLDRIEAVAGRSMGRGTGVLATIGSTAPFVGLFGTVWGIMNSFIGISEAQTTNLAVVAPGIAEALLATAIGLVAAIPAVVIYNVFARAITGYRLRLANASAGVRRLVSRDLDFRSAIPSREA
ncbi:tonB-system energizer ExbB [Paracoccus sp. MBLB3053]|uniref:Biopolymer transport protein ExbB n=1 Tax=Paracoccus aurantius TaxID=3073814 RepID=A0ABU2HN34_9RHOB|nr:tonB-system energizer ExbB [Paracoccus sp. MBLB3053]MDS9466450.1 tonB-system energizer ExbB [Paracoccus sp. MBLB3053]